MANNTYLLNGKTIRLNNKQIIGVGGEATVYRRKGQAVKVYLQPEASRDQKLRAMVNRVQSLPQEVIAPCELVYDAGGSQVVGFTMRLLDATYTEVRQLSVKKYRAQAGLNSVDIARLFLNAHQTLTAIHRAGMVVGDFNDLNLMFNGDDMLFIDTDSFQFDSFPCQVGTEAFIDPCLYGVDLSNRMQFQPGNDWYSFAVLLFKSLLLTHPYGGVHPNIKLLTQRAQQCVSVFDSAVTYPRIAYSPELLSDELHDVFERYFTRGERDPFPVQQLQDYIGSARACPSCGATYPSNRSYCPMCSTMVPVAVPQQIAVRTLVQANGPLVAWSVIGERIRLLAHEADKVVYYDAKPHRKTRRVRLFNTMPTATYGFLEECLVVSPDRTSDTLMIVDAAGDEPKAVLQTTTERFGGNQPMFGTSARHLYRLAGGYLMRGHIEYGQLIEQSVMAVMDGQTWFIVNPTADEVFGYYRVLNQQQYWLLVDDARYDADLTPLDPGEVLLQVSVSFGSRSMLIARHTQLNGKERVLIDEIDHKGRRLQSMVVPQANDILPIDGFAYVQNMILQATDSGIVQTQLDSGAERTFSQTEPVVQRGDSLQRFKDGLLAVREDRVLAIML